MHLTSNWDNIEGLNLERINSEPDLISKFPKDRSDQSALLHYTMVTIYILDLNWWLRKIKVNPCQVTGQESSRQRIKFKVPVCSGVHLVLWWCKDIQRRPCLQLEHLCQWVFIIWIISSSLGRGQLLNWFLVEHNDGSKNGLVIQQLDLALG